MCVCECLCVCVCMFCVCVHALCAVCVSSIETEIVLTCTIHSVSMPCTCIFYILGCGIVYLISVLHVFHVHSYNMYTHDTLTTHTILHRKTQDINLGLLY